MSQAGAAPPAGTQARRNRMVSAALLLALVLLVGVGLPWVERLQAAWFDVLQSLWPRQVTTLPVTVVAIDQKSLLEIGQWPWPRNVLARLVRVIHRAEPAAIGINILMPEADALSPERLLAQAQVEDRMLAEALRALPTHDAQLARALAAGPGRAGGGRHRRADAADAARAADHGARRSAGGRWRCAAAAGAARLSRCRQQHRRSSTAKPAAGA